MAYNDPTVVLLPVTGDTIHPDTRALRCMTPGQAADIHEWLRANGIQAALITEEKLNRKIANYNERVAAAS